MTTSELIALDNKRMAELHSPYNPILGVGSLVPRFEFCYGTDRSNVFLPESMREVLKDVLEYPSLQVYCQENFGMHALSEFKDLSLAVTAMRFKEDFEFWAATCAYLQDKQTKLDVNFILRKPQRILLSKLIELFWASVPMHIILLKARQWGGSTLIQLFMAWLQIFHFKNWHSAIVGDVEEQARVIRGMYARLADKHPHDISHITFSPFEGSSKTKIIQERGCIISIGSMQKPEGLRSTDLMMVHKSEVASWKKTLGKSPEDLIMSLSGIPHVHGTVDVEESTAKGVGNYFHKSWVEAVKGVSGKVPVFIPWYFIDMYTEKFTSEDERIRLVETLDEYSQTQFNEGATLEGIKWYKTKRNANNWSSPSEHWRMMAEYPTTADEAFQSTGKRVFSPHYVSMNRKHTTAPKFVGEIFAENKKDNIRFEEVAGGKFWVWFKPEYEPKIAYRYVVQVDIGATSENASYSTIRVFDRADLMAGGVEEAIATWKDHLDVDLVIWKAVQIAIWYDNALLSFESNPLDSEDARESEGDHTISLLDEIAGVYPNLFTRTDPEKIRQGHPLKYGIHTNTKTKTDYINQFKKRLREGGYVEFDNRVNDEADTYEYKESGRAKAKDGCHDDLLENTMMGLKVSDLMPLPYLVESEKSKRIDRPINAASF